MAVSNARKAWKGYSVFKRNQKGDIEWPFSESSKKPDGSRNWREVGLKLLALVPFAGITLWRSLTKVGKFFGALFSSKEVPIKMEELQGEIPEVISESHIEKNQNNPNNLEESVKEEVVKISENTVEKISEEILEKPPENSETLMSPLTPVTPMEGSTSTPTQVPEKEKEPELDEDAFIPFGSGFSTVEPPSIQIEEIEKEERLPPSEPSMPIATPTEVLAAKNAAYLEQLDRIKEKGESAMAFQERLEKQLREDVKNRQEKQKAGIFNQVSQQVSQFLTNLLYKKPIEEAGVSDTLKNPPKEKIEESVLPPPTIETPPSVPEVPVLDVNALQSLLDSQETPTSQPSRLLPPPPDAPPEELEKWVKQQGSLEEVDLGPKKR